LPFDRVSNRGELFWAKEMRRLQYGGLRLGCLSSDLLNGFLGYCFPGLGSDLGASSPAFDSFWKHDNLTAGLWNYWEESMCGV